MSSGDLEAGYDVRELAPAAELEAGYAIRELAQAADLAAVWDVEQPSPALVAEVLVELGYTVESFEHGLHRPGDEPRVGYRVQGFELDKVVGPGKLLELVATHPDRVEQLELEQAHVDVEGGVRQRLEARLDTLEAAARAWPQLSPAQKDSATRSAVRAVALLTRLQLRRLDSTGD